MSKTGSIESKKVLEHRVTEVLADGDSEKIKSEINNIIQMIVKNNDKITLCEFMIQAHKDEIIRLDDFNKVLEDKLFCMKLAL